jgi:hypothetical protein
MNKIPFFIRFNKRERVLLEKLSCVESRCQNEIIIDALYLYEIASRKLDSKQYLRKGETKYPYGKIRKH